MGKQYPYLVAKKEVIAEQIKNEEESFLATIASGLELFEKELPNTKEVFSGEVAFKLYDTYGFPLELTKEIAQEKGLTVDEKEFECLINQQRTKARNARKNAGDDAWEKVADIISAVPPTIILDRKECLAESDILSIIKDGCSTEKLQDGNKACIILTESVFYPESGGQLGDTGTIENGEFQFKVEEVTKSTNGVILHHGSIINNKEAAVGDKVVLKVNQYEEQISQT